MSGSQSLKHTPLFAMHVSLGARIVPFGGWEMPVQYQGILDEARSVRSHVGLFDVSHMGRVEIHGSGAAAYLNRIFSSDILALRIGRARYGLICNQEGGIIDDCIIYRLDMDRFLMVPNAGNVGHVLEWLSYWQTLSEKIRVRDVTLDLAMIALQGPEAAQLLSRSTSLNLSAVRPFNAMEFEAYGVHTLIARTGYTGEDGFELILSQKHAIAAWERLVDEGATPCGLGARDVLRLEAGMLLHGNDIDDVTNPYEAGLGKFVDPDREGYVARESLCRIRDKKPGRVLVGFNMIGRGIARHGYTIVHDTKSIGHVTSGSYSPTLDRNLGLGYVPIGFSAPGSRFHVDIRGRSVEAEVMDVPFYVRKRTI